MIWKRDQVEQFFGRSFNVAEGWLEMRFEIEGLKYRFWIHEPVNGVFLTVDPKDPDSPYPALEIGGRCGLITLKDSQECQHCHELYFYRGEQESIDDLSFYITRTKEGTFSISPHWQNNELKL